MFSGEKNGNVLHRKTNDRKARRKRADRIGGETGWIETPATLGAFLAER